MSMFQNQGYLDLARRFMETPSREGSQYANRYPNMQGFSRTPMGQGILTNLMQRMAARRSVARPGAPGPARGMPAPPRRGIPRTPPRADTPKRNVQPVPPGPDRRRFIPGSSPGLRDFLTPTLSRSGQRRV